MCGLISNFDHMRDSQFTHPAIEGVTFAGLALGLLYCVFGDLNVDYY